MPSRAIGGWFQQGLEPGSEPNLSDSLRDAGQEPARVIARARSEEIDRQLRAATDQAKALGIFGSPTFVVDTEVFWGDDRLDDAMRWAMHGTLEPGP
jgi:2-hydroxychromene-2-carboxylate isomerase